MRRQGRPELDDRQRLGSRLRRQLGWQIWILVGRWIRGLIWLLIVCWQAMRGRFTKTDFVGVQTARMYWTFVVALWPVLYGLVYLY